MGSNPFLSTPSHTGALSDSTSPALFSQPFCPRILICGILCSCCSDPWLWGVWIQGLRERTQLRIKVTRKSWSARVASAFYICFSGVEEISFLSSLLGISLYHSTICWRNTSFGYMQRVSSVHVIAVPAFSDGIRARGRKWRRKVRGKSGVIFTLGSFIS